MQSPDDESSELKVPDNFYIVDPAMDSSRSGNMGRLVDLVGPQLRQTLLVYEQLSMGFVVVDDLSNVLWVSPKFERGTGWSLEILQQKGLEILLPNNYHNYHQRWVKEFTESFRSMNDRGAISIPRADDSTFEAIIHIASFTLKVPDEYRHFRVAILQAEPKEIEYSGLERKIIVVGELIKNLGTRTLVFLLALASLWLVLTLGPRLLNIWERNQFNQINQSNEQK